MSAAASGSRAYDVFISYARSESKAEAEALRDFLDARLGAGKTYLDTRDAPVDERFPDDIRKALLGSRVVVAFVGETYFRKWWCLKEWHLSLAPYSRGRHPSREARALALRHLVIALPSPDMSEAEWRLLPPDAQVRTTERAANTQGVVEIALGRLSEAIATLGEKLTAAGVLAEVEDDFGAEEAIPPARPMRGCRQHPASFGPSLQGRFVGRAADLWRMHTLLVGGGPPEDVAPPCVAVRAFAGVGKSTIAREYVHRFGPTHYRGGVFWIDASQSRESLRRQHHGIWKAIDRGAPSFEELEDAITDPARLSAEISARLAAAFGSIPASDRALVVVDNVPEESAASAELSAWCPAPEKVTLLATSRSVMAGVHEQVELGLLEPAAAVSLLARHGRRADLAEDEWESIAEWAGCLPQALVLLSESLRADPLRTSELLGHARGSGAVAVLEGQVKALSGLVPAERLRGIAEAFGLSVSLLPETARHAAVLLAWFAPAPIPDHLVDAVVGRVDSAQVGRTRAVLGTRSFISFDASSGGWQMHRLLAEFLRTTMSEEEGWIGAIKTIWIVLNDIASQARACGVLLAQHLGAVAAVVRATPSIESERANEAGLLLWGVGSELQHWNMISEDRLALETALMAYRAALKLRTRDRDPVGWAGTQADIASVVVELSHGSESPAQLLEAVAAYRSALQVFNTDCEPQKWGGILYNLGIALADLGEREGGTQRHHEALAAFQLSLEVRRRESNPVEWARTQNNIGMVLLVIGLREEGAYRVEQAVAACRLALTVLTREQHPSDWAPTQSTLGSALATLGALEGGTIRLREAAAACRLAIEARTRENQPTAWASTQHILGHVLTQLGHREAENSTLEEAIAACRSALEVRTREHSPVSWAATQNNLGNALLKLGEREEGTLRLEEAVAAYRAAQDVDTRERAPLRWALSQGNLGNALVALGKREWGTARLNEAVAAYRAALEVPTREREPRSWAVIQTNLGHALRALAAREGGTARLEEAMEAYESALEVYARVPLNWAMAQACRGSVFHVLVQRDQGRERTVAEMEPYQSALPVVEGSISQDVAELRRKIALVKALIATGGARP